MPLISLGLHRTEECFREAIQEDVPNEWSKFPQVSSFLVYFTAYKFSLHGLSTESNNSKTYHYISTHNQLKRIVEFVGLGHLNFVLLA